MKHVDNIEHIYLDDEDNPPPSASSRQNPKAVESKREYKKLYYVLLGVMLVALMLTFIRGFELNRLIADFMAVFFITFATYKFIDIEGFAHDFRSFDILSKLIRPWAYIFPFIQAFMGFWYLLTEGPMTLNVLAMFVTGMAAVGAFREVGNRSRFRYPALGTLFRLPLARVSLIENLTMFILAFVIIFV